MTPLLRPALPMLAGLLLAGAAGAGPTARLVWTGTTGSGLTGTDTIEALPGDTLSLDVLLEIDPSGLTAWGLSLFGTNITAVSGQECPRSAGDPFYWLPGECHIGPFDVVYPLDPGVTVVPPGDLLHFDGGSLTAIFTNTTVIVGRGIFTAQGAGEVALGGEISDGAFNTWLASDVAYVVPEPATLTLVAGGLSALALAHRRRYRSR